MLTTALLQDAESFSDSQKKHLLKIRNSHPHLNPFESIAVVSYGIKNVDSFSKFARRKNLESAIKLFGEPQQKTKPVLVPGETMVARGQRQQKLVLSALNTYLFLTSQQLREKTGLSHNSLGHAVRCLVSQGLVIKHFNKHPLYSKPGCVMPFSGALQYERYLRLWSAFGDSPFTFRDVRILFPSLTHYAIRLFLKQMVLGPGLEIVENRQGRLGRVYRVKPLILTNERYQNAHI